ncbi:BID domain-containing T4SS effector [Bartonella taylorii]|uniref:BID domain-containing T4SS effector n=1 Tax=Bartonella taylorii TaxID=33046 RepID=UPI001FED2E01|nr:BID domain-containing T4SS effector [Bartonella taylorii]
MPSTTETASKTTITLSEEEITKLLQYNRLVKSYQEEVQRWCQIIYGNSRALQDKIEEIQRNPATGKGLSSQIATNPRRIHKLSGVQVFGMKNSARKHAEESLSTLCGVVECYVEAVRISRENLSMTPQAELNHYERAIGSDAIANILKKPYHPNLRREVLSNDEISDKTRQHPMVKKHQAQIDYWCEVVFGKSNILQQQTEALFTTPAMAEELTWRIAAYPQSIGNYAGFKALGFKNSARKHAESGLSHLLDAVDNYASTVERVKKGFLQVQTATQGHSESTARLSQNLSLSSKLSENLTAIKNPKTTEASTHTLEKAQDIRSRRVAILKTMALAS